MVRKIVLSLIAVFVFLAYATAQNRQISGTVSDANGHPVAGATVIVDGTSLGTTTNTAGEYTLSAPVNGTLVVTFVGFEPQQLPIAGKTRINVTMKEDAQAIDDVIVVAFGTAKKEAFTGSAAVIKSDEIAKVQTSNVATALVGRVAGVQTSSTSGDLGKTPSIRVRGFGSINAGKEPLWIVDGMPYEGDLNNLNTNDIESMTVLKDAASNALYGARGANGVIMVTTKKAKSGDAVVTIDAKWGVNSKALEEYDVITSPAQYYETHFKALYGYYAQTNPAAKAYALASSGLTSNGTGGLGYNVYTVPEGQALIGTNGKLNPNATLGRKIIYNGQEYWLTTPDDWIDEAYQSAFRQEYNVNISGATERSSFYASLGYLDNTGIIKSSALERYTARLKADYQAKKWLKVGGNMSYAHFSNSNGNSNEGSASSTANIFAFSAQMPPIYPVYIRDGSGRIMVDDNGYQMYDYGDKGNAGLTRPLLPGANGLQTSWLNKKKAEGNAFSGSGFVDISLYKGLKLTVNGSTNIDETRTTYLNNQYYGQFAEAGGTISKYHTRDIAYNLQQILNYNETFGKHNVGLMVGHEYYQKKYYYLSGTKSKLFSYDNEELGGAVVDGAGAHSYIDDYNSEGYFMRAQYDYAGRYFVSGSYRRDASSRFHPDHRWGNFWSVGAAWLLNQENWFDAPWVNLLKLKASYGSQGNDNIGNSTIGYYLYTDTYSIENNNGEIAVLFGQKGNPNITWETNTNLNIGTEFGFWNNRLSGSVDFFNRKTSDMLFAFSVPSSLGYSSYYANVGDMVNRGVEVELNADLIRTKNVLWSFNLNLTHVKNEVTYLAPEHKSTTVEGYKGYIDGSYFVGEGLPLYTYYLRSYAGVDPETGASLWYKDVKGDDGKITRTKTSDYTSATRYLHDSAIPSVYGGFSTSVSAYGVDFSISFNYQIGGKVYDSGYASFMSSPYGTTVGTNYHKDILKAWTPENKGSDIPRLQYGDQYTTSVSDRFLTDASYLNISNINVGYTLPSKITQKFGVQKLRVYLACDNVVYWSKRQGLDPRYSFTGATNFSNYSPIRTISGGVTVQF